MGKKYQKVYKTLITATAFSGSGAEWAGSPLAASEWAPGARGRQAVGQLFEKCPQSTHPPLYAAFGGQGAGLIWGLQVPIQQTRPRNYQGQ